MPQLRDYQLEAVAAVLDAWEEGEPDPAVVWATGLGKTVLLTELARVVHRAHGWRTCVLVHRDELINQTVNKFKDADPNIRVGIVQGQRMGIFGDVVVASVQTLVRRLGKIDPAHFDVVITDEVHHGEANSYKKILAHFAKARRLGVTATPERGDGKGLGAVISRVVDERRADWAIEQGYLVPAEVIQVTVPGLDTKTIRRDASGDISAGELGKRMATARAGELIAAAYDDLGRDREGRLRRAICFAPTVAIAQAWAEDFRAVGARCHVITGDTTPADRARAYRDVAEGRADILSSVMVLTEGFDLPAVEVAVIGRATKSTSLLVQMIGRVLRLSPGTGKTSALVLDVVGSVNGDLARPADLRLPEPEELVRERDPDAVVVHRGPAPVLAPPEAIAWVARELGGRVIKGRRAGYTAPPWLRTRNGLAFLPRTQEYPFLIYARPSEESIWWIKPQVGRAQPLPLDADQDPTDVHPGIPESWANTPCSDKQRRLLVQRRLVEHDAPLTKAQAHALIEVMIVTREASHDGLLRP